MKIADLLVRIGGDSSGLQKELGATERQLKRAFGSGGMELSNAALKGIAGIGAAFGAAGLAAIKMASDFKTTERQFTTLIGNADEAKKLLNGLYEFGKNSPFDMKGMEKNAQQMLAFKFASQDIIPILQQVGDYAAATGRGEEGLNNLLSILGRINMTGNVTSKEMKALSLAGVDAYEYLAQATGQTTKEVAAQVKAGTVDATTAINSIVSGLQKDFGGGMMNTQKEVMGMIGTIQHNLGIAFKSIGDSLTNNNHLREFFEAGVEWTDKFSTAVKGSGLNQALRDMVPPGLAASIFAFGGALMGVAIPAMKIAAGHAILMLLPFIKFIAIGAALGAIAYVIWAAWEPLGELFSAFISKLGAVFEGGFSAIQIIIYTFVEKSLEYLSILTNAIGGELAASVQKGLGNVRAALGEAKKGYEDSVKRSGEASAKMDSAWAAVGDSISGAGARVANQVSAISTTFTGLSKSSSEATNVAKDGMDKLAKKAEQVSEQIEKEWASSTKTQLQQLDIWYADMTTKLNEVAAANENHERDKQRLAEAYSAKRIKIINDEAQKVIDEYNKVYSTIKSIAQNAISGLATGGQKIQFELDFKYADKMKEIEKSYQDLQNSFANADAEGEKRMLAQLNQYGMQYKLTEQGNLDFSKSMEESKKALAAERYNEEYINAVQNKQLLADLNSAYNTLDMGMLQEKLTAENAILLNDMEGKKSMMETYQAAFLAANATGTQLMADLYSNAFSGLSTALSDIFTGAKSAGEAFQALGKQMIKVVADFVAQKIAGMLITAAIGKSTQTATTAASIAAASAQLPIWSKLASAVSLASFGANAGPAMAGMVATYGLGTALSIPGLATGGQTTGATIALIGEGKYDEAVLPLDRRVFSRIADMIDVDTSNSGKTDIVFNNYGDINNDKDYEDMYSDFAYAVLTARKGR